MPTETQNRPSRIHLEKCFPEREWPKTHIPLVTESGPGRRRSTPPPRPVIPHPQIESTAWSADQECKPFYKNAACIRYKIFTANFCFSVPRNPR